MMEANSLEFEQLCLPLGPDLPNKTLLRPDEVARFLRVGRSTVYRWCDEGILMACSPTTGTVRIFRLSVLDALKKSLR